MAHLEPLLLDDGRYAFVGFTDRSEGDLAPGGPASVLTKRRMAISPAPWTSLNQVHGAKVVSIREPGEATGVAADAAITVISNATLSVYTADCAPVVLVAKAGIIGIAHAGWRGLEAGVIESTVAEMYAVGADEITAYVGPCIHPECYEFAPGELVRLRHKFGAGVAGKTSWGTPALDVPTAILAILAREGVKSDFSHCICTACGPSWYSYRARQESGRQAAYVRMS